MKRTALLVAAAMTLGAALMPAAASAKITELGVPKTQLVSPACPAGVTAASCTIVLTRVTALETIRDNVAYPTTVKSAGQIVAFTVGLSRLSSNAATARSDISYLDSTYGGNTELAITVLAPSGTRRHRTWKVTAESPSIHVQPYLGQVVQFPLLATLPVVRGDVIALTTPTWAPVLSIDLSTKSFAYRQSRSSNCGNPPAASQAQAVGKVTYYGCNYAGTRVEYSATEVTNPVALHPIHAPLERVAVALRAAADAGATGGGAF